VPRDTTSFPHLYRRFIIASKTYYYEALVERTCTDTITIAVEADGPQQAKALAHKALLTFPDKVDGDEVKAMLVENRDFRSSAVLDLTRKVLTNEES
jgi:hypothetical protein